MAPGIPRGTSVERLAYNAMSDAIVVQARFPAAKLTVSHLLWRKARDSKYLPLAKQPKGISFEGPILSQTSPALYYSTLRYYSFDEGIAADWLGLTWYDLSGNCIRSELSAGQIVPPRGYRAPTIVTPVAAGKEEYLVYCTVGFDRLVEGGSTVDFFLSEIDVRNGKVRILSQLTTPFA